MERATVLCLGPVEGVLGYAQGRDPVRAEKVRLQLVVPALEAEHPRRGILLHKGGAAAPRLPRHEVLVLLLRRGRCARPSASVGEALRGAVVLGQGDHARHHALLMVLRDREQVLALPLPPAPALRDVGRLRVPEEVGRAGPSFPRSRAVALPGPRFRLVARGAFSSSSLSLPLSLGLRLLPRGLATSGRSPLQTAALPEVEVVLDEPVEVEELPGRRTPEAAV